MAMIETRLEVEKINGTQYYFRPESVKGKSSATKICTTFLMPDYDEYGAGYKDRSAAANDSGEKTGEYDHLLIVDGKIGGTWKTVSVKNRTSVEVKPFPSAASRKEDITVAVLRYEAFSND
jgi:hypothetical protein